MNEISRGVVTDCVRVATGESSRRTMVSSVSKISFNPSLSRLNIAGGVGVRLVFLDDLCFDFLEKIPAVHV